MTGTATYLYAITRPTPAGELGSLYGVAGAPVRRIDDGRLACLVSTVELAEFGEDALRTNLEDLGWLERTARQHDSVVQRSAAATTTLPLRLATICRDDTSACERLSRLGSRATTVLAELDGREEWGVKLYAVEDPDPDPPDSPAGASTGAAYLRSRRRQLAHRDDAAASAVRDADTLFRRLAQHGVDARRHRPQDQRLTGAAQPMVLNAAFLLGREQVAGFRAAVAELAAARPADSLVLTGPWPPYSFATVDEP